MARRRRAGERRRGKGAKGAADAYAADAERLAEQLRREVKRRWATVLGEDLDAVRPLDRVLRRVRDEGIDELILPAGFFFGELLRGRYGGRYVWNPLRKALALELGRLVIYPLETVRRVIEDPEARPLEHVLMILAKRMSDLEEQMRKQTDGR